MFGPGRPWAFLCVCLGRHTRSSCVVFELACTGAAKSDPQAVEIYRNIMFARTYVPDLSTSVDYIPFIGHSRTSDAALSIHLHFNFDLDMKTIYHLIIGYSATCISSNLYIRRLPHMISYCPKATFMSMLDWSILSSMFTTTLKIHIMQRAVRQVARTANVAGPPINQGFRSKTAIDKDNATAKGSGGEGGEKS